MVDDGAVDREGRAMGLEDILGQVLAQAGGRSGSQNGDDGGGLGDLLNQLGGGGSAAREQTGTAGMAGLVGMLAPLIAGFLEDDGLQKLLGRFQNAGLGERANSWVGTGANEPLRAADVEHALSSDEIDAVASRLGISREQAAAVLAELLPGMVDAVTPTGQVPSSEELAERLGH